jgi:hypothetical protein
VFALLPVVILLRRVRPRLLWAIGGATLVVAVGLSTYFFVPTLGNGGLI